MTDLVIEPRVGYEWEVFPSLVGRTVPKVLITGRVEPPFGMPDVNGEVFKGRWYCVESKREIAKRYQEWDTKMQKWCDFLEGSVKILIDAEWLEHAEINFDHWLKKLHYIAYWRQPSRRLARKFCITYEEFDDLERVAEKFKFQMHVLEVAVRNAKLFYAGEWKEPVANDQTFAVS